MIQQYLRECSQKMSTTVQYIIWSVCHNNRLATTKLITTESQITTGGNLTQVICLNSSMNLTSNES